MTHDVMCRQPVHCANCGVHAEADCRCSAGWTPLVTATRGATAKPAAADAHGPATPPTIHLELDPREAARLHLLAATFADTLRTHPITDTDHGFDPTPVLTALRKLDQALTAAGYRHDHIGWRIPNQETADAH